MSAIITAGAAGFAAPSKAAEIGAAVARRIPPGAGEVAAQGFQAAVNMAVVGAAAFMEATVRQHGKSPDAVLNEMQIDMQIQQDSSTAKTND